MSSSSSQQSHNPDTAAIMNMTPEDLAQAPVPTWQDYVEMEQLDDGPPPPDDEVFLSDEYQAPHAIKAPVERELFTEGNKGENINETTAVTLYDPKNISKAIDLPVDKDEAIETTLNKLANKLGTTSLDKYVQEDEGSEVCADMSTKLGNLTLSNNSDKDLIDVEFSALLSYSTNLMMSTGNAQTKKVYERYQTMYKAYLKLYSLHPKNPKSMQTFMVVLHHKYSGSTLWTIYSCVNSWYKANHSFNLKDWPVLTGLMKTITANHVIKKAPTFSETNMEAIFKNLRDESELQTFEGHRSLLRLISTSLTYYGLCRSADLMNIESDDVRKDEKRGHFYILFEPS